MPIAQAAAAAATQSFINHLLTTSSNVFIQASVMEENYSDPKLATLKIVFSQYLRN